MEGIKLNNNYSRSVGNYFPKQVLLEYKKALLIEKSSLFHQCAAFLFLAKEIFIRTWGWYQPYLGCKVDYKVDREIV